MENRYNNK